METERGVHMESLLATLGSLAGFCCIDSTLKAAEQLGRPARECGIVDVETSDGSRYYFGDPVNTLLFEGQMSVGMLVAGAINQLGSEDYPDFAEVAAHVAGSLGKADFGLPRVPDQHKPHDLPINYVRNIWPATLPLLNHYAPVLKQRPIVFGLAIHRVMQMGKDVISPAMAGRLVMECAIPMAKLDPAGIDVENATP